jgi:hypothetical protein
MKKYLWTNFSKYNLIDKVKVFIAHLQSNHSTYNMPIYSREDESGWYCPFCTWEHVDMADLKMRDAGY